MRRSGHDAHRRWASPLGTDPGLVDRVSFFEEQVRHRRSKPVSSANMLALQEELSSTENRVAFARQHYNDAVLEYNTARETVPASFFAGGMGFGPEPLFQLETPAERAVPQVQF